MRLRLGLLLTIFWILSISAEEASDPFISSLTNTQSLLPTTIQSVSAISGEWLESETDFIVKGPDPLVLSRFYSADHSTGNLGYNWEFNRPHQLIVTLHKSSKSLEACLHHPSGIKTVHKAKESEHHITSLPISCTRGLTNCRSMEISGRTNLHNMLLKVDRDKEFCESITGSGHVIHYDLDYKGKYNMYYFSPVYERVANGNLFVFKNQRIIASNADESIEYGSIKRHSQDTATLEVKASDGNAATYSFQCFSHQTPPTFPEDNQKSNPQRKRYCLKQVNYTHKPQINYEYTYPTFEEPIDTPPNPLLKKKEWPLKRFQQVTYYHAGRNVADKVTDISISKDNFRISRVKEIKAPVGHNEEAIVTHRFVYEADDSSAAKRDKSFSGKTEVYDAYLYKTVYTYNKEHRPTVILRYLKNGEIYSKEKFVWDEGEEKSSGVSLKESISTEMLTEKQSAANLSLSRSHVSHENIRKKLLESQSSSHSHQVGNLIGKYLQDKEGNIQHALFFRYDERGNIKRERFYGNLTGTSDISIQVDDNKEPKENGVEHYTKHFTYSDDAFNHLLSENEDNGKSIEYIYDPTTQQVAAKYIKDGENIQLRQFFFYDQSTAALIKMIKDDGSHTDPQVLNDVKERLITEITLTNHYPYGQPKVITEKYWDSKQELFLKKVEYHYDSKGNVKQQDHYDRENGEKPCYSLYWEFDDHGNVKKEVNALGYEILKTYDENDNLKSVCGPRPKDEIKYGYDFANRLTVIERHMDGQNLITQHSYDFKGNRSATIDHFGQTTEYKYDEFNRLKKTIYPSIQLTDNWIINPIAEIEYDINHHPIFIKEPGDEITRLTYNSRGKPLRKTYPDGTTECCEYYLDGSLAKSIAANGTETRYKRDFLGRVVEEEIVHESKTISKQIFTYKGTKLISKRDPENCLTTYSYDGAGRLISETCEEAYKSYTYDSLGRVAKIIQSFGNHPEEMSVQAFTYDFLDRLLEERVEDSSGIILKCVSYQYDELGNKTSIIRKPNYEESFSTQIKYQADGKPLLIMDDEGNKTYFTYDYTYRNHLNQIVLRVTRTDSLGRTTTSIYDTLDRLREISQCDAFGQLLAKQEIFYDPKGRKIKTIDFIISQGIEQRHYINAWRYHPSGQEDMIVEAVGSPDEKYTRIIYNAYSQKEKVIKPNRCELNYTYDALGRLKTLTSSDGSIDYLYHYNLRHQVIEIEDGQNQTKMTRQYKTIGHLGQETLGNGLSLTYSYDRMGRVTNVLLPDQSSIAYQYDAAYLKEVQRYQLGKMLYHHQNVQYDLTGSLCNATLIEKGGSINYAYDKLGRIQSIKNAAWTQEVPVGGYDGVGRLMKMTVKDQIDSKDYTYTYDDLDHLQKEEGDVPHHYKTDSLHNRLQKNKSTYLVNELNQLKKQGDCRYNYDVNGNLHEKIKGKHKTIYDYDALDRLISVSTPEGITTYQYDAFHRRLSKTQNAITVRYLYQGQDEIGCVNTQGDIRELRILGLGIDAEIGATIALELHGKTYAPIHDRQGNMNCLVDAYTGKVAESYRYSAFGEETILNSQGQKVSHTQTGNPWRFASKRHDPETGWIYFGRRYYDAENGRWTTPDPISFADGPNLYAYLHHNPLNAYDAYGLIGEAYRDSCEVGMNSPHYSPFADLDRSEIQSNDQTRAGYINNLHHSGVGIFHGAINFFTNQMCDFASLACSIGSHDLEESLEEKFSYQLAFAQWQYDQMAAFDNWFADCLCVDQNNKIYQASRLYTTAALELGSLVVGGYGIAKGSVKLVRVAKAPISQHGMNAVGKLAGKQINCTPASSSQTVNFIWSEVKLPNNTSYKGWVDLRPTLDRIRNGTKFPHRNDGSIFKNREGRLPVRELNYYREFVHPTPNVNGPGSQRIICVELPL